MLFLKKISNSLTIILTIFALNAQAKSFFITNKEYGQMLYSDPRGVGCNVCHGSSGEGFLIYKYTHKGKNMFLNAPKINHLSYKRFKKGIQSRNASLMPQYDLTDSEIHTLYSYLMKGDDNVTRR